MTIGYSTKWPKSMGPEYAGKPNHFVDKIWAGLMPPFGVLAYEMYTEMYQKRFGDAFSEYDQLMINPKIHTFRTDPNDRWKVGMKIHPVIKNRTKNRFQFAPVLEVKGIQKIEIYNMNGESDVPLSYSLEYEFEGEVFENTYAIWIDDDKLLSMKEVETLAINDGFESVDQFFAWFNKDFTGKIIHWTNIKY